MKNILTHQHRKALKDFLTAHETLLFLLFATVLIDTEAIKLNCSRDKWGNMLIAAFWLFLLKCGCALRMKCYDFKVSEDLFASSFHSTLGPRSRLSIH